MGYDNSPGFITGKKTAGPYRLAALRRAHNEVIVGLERWRLCMSAEAVLGHEQLNIENQRRPNKDARAFTLR